MALISSIAAHWPYRCTGMIAFVREVMLRLDLRRIDVVVGEVDVDEHRRRAEAIDDAGRGEERIGGDDDLVAGADAEHHQRDEQRVGAGRESDRVTCVWQYAAKSRSKSSTRLPEDEVLRLVDLLGHAKDFVANRGVLQFQIEQRDRHGGESVIERPQACSGAAVYDALRPYSCLERQSRSRHLVVSARRKN